MARKTRRARKKYYILKKGSRVSIFTGRQPRQAALKAATRGYTEIRLRERGRRNKDGTYSIHVFKGSRQKVTVSADNRVDWLPSSVWKPTVRKVGVERVKTIRGR
ncbi:MAG: non-histone chromosomal MC1 family protein [Candidatus Aenigmatarchaeota archaeon]|nr:non-histone chromosomal MC1 family protein [Nanoarchaeota archaeon]